MRRVKRFRAEVVPPGGAVQLRAPTPTDFGGVDSDAWAAPGHPEYESVPSTPWTLEIWIDSVGAGIEALWENLGSGNALVLSSDAAGPSLTLEFPPGPGGHLVLTSSILPTPTKMQLCRAADDTWTYYFDGVADTMVVDATDLSVGTPQGLRIGRADNVSGYDPFDGAMRRVAIYALDLAGVDGDPDDAEFFWSPIDLVGGGGSGDLRAVNANAFTGVADEKWKGAPRVEYDLPPVAERTIELWVTLAPTNTTILCFGQAPNRWRITNAITNIVSLTGLSFPPDGTVLSTAGDVTAPNTKLQICRAADNTWTWYINGVADTSVVNAVDMSHFGDGFTDGLYIGSDQAGGSPFDGSLYRVAIYHSDLAGVEGDEADAKFFWAPEAS